MNRNYYTRRDVLTLIGLGAAAIILSSCASKPSTQSRDFSFVQLCDTQLGMGGYEHDVEIFCQAVERINDLNPDFAASALFRNVWSRLLHRHISTAHLRQTWQLPNIG